MGSPFNEITTVWRSAQLQGLVLLCYLALNAGNNKALEQARALNALEGTARSF